MAPLQLEAAEILRRSEQGVCRPFFIRDIQGDIYVVKGVGGAGKAALTSELICAELGSRLGLPIPPYGIMAIPQGLISFTAIDGADELDGGPAFASKLVENATTLIYPQVPQIPPQLKQRVLVFDKWVKNGDRRLTEKGGNVNLLWEPSSQLVVIDHNVAFDLPSNDADCIEDHVFSEEKTKFDDLLIKSEHLHALDNALGCWDTIIDLLPEEWVYRDIWDEDSLVHPTLDERFELLDRIHNGDFWRMV
ncbi:HipA family kinase [Vreelandella alkaliphila]|uniref:HipA family kinase n=1 Tax=Vreelandella alkaliphila TaxID=272774 RepID=UPI003FD7D2C2